ncbi:hypothetical protein MKW92_032987 [Papaver armeniacum]|nr:hypothetical protein MKW92_032987 [Papaver armeniacum]
MTNLKAATSLLQIISFLSFLGILINSILPHPILSKKSSEGFEFLKHLEGCQKGQTVKGLREVKLYLKKFGYADVHKNRTHKKEIITYQLYYHLKATGALDAETVKPMTVPRCGLPDIVKGKTPMTSGKKEHISGDIKTLRAVCSSAFARWAEVTHFTFSEAVHPLHKADIVIGFQRGDHGDSNSFDGPGGTIAHAFSPTNGRFHYDAEENWSTYPARGTMDMETVALHEIGHLLGLGHSKEPNAPSELDP